MSNTCDYEPSSRFIYYQCFIITLMFYHQNRKKKSEMNLKSNYWERSLIPLFSDERWTIKRLSLMGLFTEHCVTKE